jgi:hypothetical protein
LKNYDKQRWKGQCLCGGSEITIFQQTEEFLAFLPNHYHLPIVLFCSLQTFLENKHNNKHVKKANILYLNAF